MISISTNFVWFFDSFDFTLLSKYMFLGLKLTNFNNSIIQMIEFDCKLRGDQDVDQKYFR